MGNLLNLVKEDRFNIKIHEDRVANFEEYKFRTFNTIGFPELYIAFAYNVLDIQTTGELDKLQLLNSLPMEIQGYAMETPTDKSLRVIECEGVNLDIKNREVKQINFGEQLLDYIILYYPHETNTIKGLYYRTVQEYIKREETGLDENVLRSMVIKFSEIILGMEEDDIFDFYLNKTSKFKILMESPELITNISVDTVNPNDISGDIFDLKGAIDKRIKELSYASLVIKSRVNRIDVPSIYEEIPKDLIEDVVSKAVSRGNVKEDDLQKKKIDAQRKFFAERDKQVFEYLRSLYIQTSRLISKMVKREIARFNLETMRQIEYLSRYKGYYEDLTELGNITEFLLNNMQENPKNSKYIIEQKVGDKESRLAGKYKNLLVKIESALDLEVQKKEYIEYIIKEDTRTIKEIYYLYLY